MIDLCTPYWIRCASTSSKPATVKNWIHGKAVESKTNDWIEMSSTDDGDDISSIDDQIFDRFCIDILPKLYHNAKHLILESMSIGCIRRVGKYPNLTSFRLFSFGQHITLNHFKVKENDSGHEQVLTAMNTMSLIPKPSGTGTLSK
ncbi:unnamed protein product [Rotaria sp. Silwood1]|nr:unnamed protein product [Rotaria sp. Silwood1]CAF1329156.1 unnamed protein product [Rotaria sp. Silwood1]CAF1330326.1 unnamed protein product [Rotaria sp. Silwood1]